MQWKDCKCKRNEGFLVVMILEQVLKMGGVYTDGNGGRRKRKLPKQQNEGKNPLGMLDSPTWPAGGHKWL